MHTCVCEPSKKLSHFPHFAIVSNVSSRVGVTKPNAFRRRPQYCRTVDSVFASFNPVYQSWLCIRFVRCGVATMSQVFHALLNDYKVKVFRNIFITDSHARLFLNSTVTAAPAHMQLDDAAATQNENEHGPKIKHRRSILETLVPVRRKLE